MNTLSESTLVTRQKMGGVSAMPKFTVLRSYTVVESYEVEAPNEDEAVRMAVVEKEGYTKSYDGEYDKEVTVEEGWG